MLAPSYLPLRIVSKVSCLLFFTFQQSAVAKHATQCNKEQLKHKHAGRQHSLSTQPTLPQRKLTLLWHPLSLQHKPGLLSEHLLSIQHFKIYNFTAKIHSAHPSLSKQRHKVVPTEVKNNIRMHMLNKFHYCTFLHLKDMELMYSMSCMNVFSLIQQYKNMDIRIMGQVKVLSHTSGVRAHCNNHSIMFEKLNVISQYQEKCKYLIKKVKSFCVLCLKSESSQVSWIHSQSQVDYRSCDYNNKGHLMKVTWLCPFLDIHNSNADYIKWCELFKWHTIHTPSHHVGQHSLPHSTMSTRGSMQSQEGECHTVLNDWWLIYLTLFGCG